MYGMFTYIWLIFMVNVGKYTYHTWILWVINTLGIDWVFNYFHGCNSDALLIVLPISSLDFFGGIDYYLGVSKITGTPKWMVKIMENPKTLFQIHLPHHLLQIKSKEVLMRNFRVTEF